MSAETMKIARALALLGAVTSLGACSWVTDFKEQPKFDPWESTSDTVPMRGNPQNSVPVYGSMAPGYAVSRMALPGTVDSMSSLVNPVAADERSLAKGRKYYTINCAVCHGFAGKGDGPATKYGMPGIAIAGPSANAQMNLKDGYIWGMMRNGRGLMPSYNRIEELDRWDVVNYLRGLQGRYQVVVGPVGLPGETGDKVPGFSQLGPTRPSPYYRHAGSQADVTRGLAWPQGATTAPAGLAPAGAPATRPNVDSSVVPAPAATPSPAPANATKPAAAPSGGK